MKKYHKAHKIIEKLGKNSDLGCLFRGLEFIMYWYIYEQAAIYRFYFDLIKFADINENDYIEIKDFLLNYYRETGGFRILKINNMLNIFFKENDTLDQFIKNNLVKDIII